MDAVGRNGRPEGDRGHSSSTCSVPIKMDRGTRGTGCRSDGNEASCHRNGLMGGVKASSTRVGSGTEIVGGNHDRREIRECRTGIQHGSEPRQNGGTGTPSANRGRRHPIKLEPSKAHGEAPRHKMGNARGLGRNAPPSAPRREYTLFDHLLMSNSKFGIIPTQTTNEDPKGKCDARTRQSSASGASPSAAANDWYSQEISPPTGNGRGPPLCKGKNAGGETDLMPKRSVHRLPGSGENVRKLGKQRLGQKKRKLSSLKKRILLHRAAQWGYEMSSSVGRSSSYSCTEAKSISTARAGQLWVVNIRNLIDEEDVEDEEDRVEVERDLRHMASEFGGVIRVEVPRSLELSGTTAVEVAPVKVFFPTPEEAERARAGFHGRVVAGNTLEAEVTDELTEREENVDVVTCGKNGGGVMNTEENRQRSDSCSLARGTDAPFSPKGAKVEKAAASAARASAAAQCPNLTRLEDSKKDDRLCGAHIVASPDHPWVVVVRNLIDVEDDLEEDEDYAEVYVDTTEIVGAYSRPVSVNIVSFKNDGEGEGEGDQVREVIATFASRGEAEQCVAGLHGRRIGGKELTVELVEPPADLDLPSDALEHGSIGNIGLSLAHGAAEAPSDTRTTTRGKGTWKMEIGDGSDGGGGIVGTIAATSAPKCSARLGETTAAHGWRVVVRNLIEHEDLEEDDDYAESRADFAAMTSEYGHVSALYIPRSEEEAIGACAGKAKLGEAVAVFGSLQEARTCARGLDSRTVGGKRLEAVVLSSPIEEARSLGRNVDLSSGQRPSHGKPHAVHQPKRESQAGVAQGGQGFVTPPRPEENTEDTFTSEAPSMSCGEGMKSAAAGGLPGATSQAASAGASEPVTALVAAAASAATTNASSKNNGSFAVLRTAERGKRISEKYKHIAALPKHPGSSGWGPKTYETQVLLLPSAWESMPLKSCAQRPQIRSIRPSRFSVLNSTNSVSRETPRGDSARATCRGGLF